MSKPFENTSEEAQTAPSSSPDHSKSWKESFSNAAAAAGKYAAKLAIPVGIFMTGAAFANIMTNMYNKNERQIIDIATSSNPTPPIIISDNLQVVLSDTSMTIISHGIPCEIPLDDPSNMEVMLGNTGEATVSETTSILQTLGITSNSQVNKRPADNAEAILRLRYEAAAACRTDILRAQDLNADSAQSFVENNIAPTYIVPGNE